jgi:uncharacterized membrane protein
MPRFFALLLTSLAVAWTATLFLAPFALLGTHPRLVSAAAFVYGGAGRICHQRSDRSFHLAGVQLPVCARCTGLYVSGAAGAIAAWLGSRRRLAVPRRTRAILVAAAVPTALTVALELLGLVHPSNTMRALAALPLGAAAGWAFVRSLRAERLRPRRASGASRAAASGGGAPRAVK